MEFKIITDQEFDAFSNIHPQGTFYQDSAWAKIKNSTGWNSHYLAVFKKNKIIGATMILSKQTFFSWKIFYAPRGFLIDYNDLELLSFFTTELKKYLKKNKAIFLKIDPNVIYKSRDINGNITNEINNSLAITNLTKNNFKHFGFNVYQETMQPRWTFVKNINNRDEEDIFNEMDRITRQIIRKNEKNFIKTRFIDEEELLLFKDIMQKTGDRRSFIDRSLSYYQKMYKELNPKKMIKIMVAELEADDLVAYLEESIEKTNTDMITRQDFYKNNQDKMSAKNYQKKQQTLTTEIQNYQKKLLEAKTFIEKYGSTIPLSAVLFTLKNKEVVALLGGSYEEFMSFNASYTIHWEMIKYAIEKGYDRYNFYGITGDFNPQHELYGLYLFKKGFFGYVEELIGEFDFIVNKGLYILYKIAFGSYKFLKKIKQKIKR